jgi:hypothetical protein
VVKKKLLDCLCRQQKGAGIDPFTDDGIRF